MKISKLALDCLLSLTPENLRVAEQWAETWNETQWAIHTETLAAVEAANPDLPFSLADYFAAWRAQYGPSGDPGGLSLLSLKIDLRAAREQEKTLAGLQTCFSGIHTGGIEA